jgi:DNA-binding MarR family transcriptional regulator
VLEERGLVMRQPNADDGRSHLLELTDEGRAIHGEVMPLARAMEAEIFATLDAAEIHQLQDLLRRIFAQTEKMRPAPRS